VPAAAVIPTPRVCERDAAVKKSVVVGKKTIRIEGKDGGADGDDSIAGREMKCQDPWWTKRGESGDLVGV
jgi:hypothetical protein